MQEIQQSRPSSPLDLMRWPPASGGFTMTYTEKGIEARRQWVRSEMKKRAIERINATNKPAFDAETWSMLVACQEQNLIQGIRRWAERIRLNDF